MKLNININSNLQFDCTGAYGSIGYKQSSNNHVVDFYTYQPPQYFKNGISTDLSKLPNSIKKAIFNTANRFGWNIMTTD